MEAWVCAGVSLCGICGGQSGHWDKGFLQVLWFYPLSVIPPCLHTHIYDLGGGTIGLLIQVCSLMLQHRTCIQFCLMLIGMVMVMLH
jgi:hypothetical protein